MNYYKHTKTKTKCTWNSLRLKIQNYLLEILAVDTRVDSWLLSRLPMSYTSTSQLRPKSGTLLAWLHVCNNAWCHPNVHTYRTPYEKHKAFCIAPHQTPDTSIQSVFRHLYPINCCWVNTIPGCPFCPTLFDYLPTHTSHTSGTKWSWVAGFIGGRTIVTW